MFSRAPLNSRSATSVRRSPSDSGQRDRPKSDTARTRRKTSAKRAQAKGDKKADIQTRETEVSPEQILEQCQEEDVNRVFEINLHAQKLTRVPDIHKFTKLRILDLSCNHISAVSGLDESTDLRELKLYSNKIEEISGLDRLKELNYLLLHHNRIKKIGKGLAPVRKVKVLRLDSNLLTTLEHQEIGCCSQITILDISNNKLSNISAVNSLSALEELDLSTNRISKVPDISRCKHLQELDLSRNQISDISGLRDLSGLNILRLESNQLTTLSSLGKHKNLQELYLGHNRISTVETFSQQFPSLEILNICHNQIKSFEILFPLSNSSVAELYIAGNPCLSSESVGYHQELHKVIPSLEIVDGVSLKRPSSSRGKPLMRPLSASQVLSSRQVEEQLKAAMLEESTAMESLKSRFSIMRDLFNSLPTEHPKHHWITTDKDSENDETPLDRPGSNERPVSRCSSRSRIADARAFAAQHFTKN
ncbi:protein phosphatase 1 regulatory subunit SDS22 homolog [Nematostella vectensis]|uniref:protein phosphatase 1 regulatory subunit SDS22 homolog n=1 Tax=Nematostella vectensis TaxID=45351 RepID=UPI0020774B53|nr:protein phosphatase 1 regulatory subunit SDS22 homolog [Nematostella vectensis]